MIQSLGTLLFGLAGVILAVHFHLPGGAFTGAMAGAAAARLNFAAWREPPLQIQSFARIILGLTIGISVNETTLQTISGAALPVALMIGFLILLSFLTAAALSRVFKMPLVSALCGASPGAASAMVIVAGDLGGDRPLVAMLHILRLSVIVAIVPMIVAYFFAETAPAAAGLMTQGPGLPPLVIAKIAGLIAGGLTLGIVFKKKKVPAAEILAGIVIAALANPLLLHLPGLPPLLSLFAQWIIGTSIGSGITKSSLKVIKAFTAAALVMTTVLIAIGFLLGWLLSVFSSIDILTAIIGSCPGGLEAMIILAGELGADVQLVAAMHTARLIIVMLILPFLVRRTTQNSIGKLTIPSAGTGPRR